MTFAVLLFVGVTPAPMIKSGELPPIAPAVTFYARDRWVGYSPAQIRHAYGVDALGLSGRGQVIAIVTAYASPTIAADVDVFSQTFGLPLPYGGPAFPCTASIGPHPCLERINPNPPSPYQEDWAQDTAMAVEWAHAIAADADILVVQAPQSTYADLLGAVDLATARGAKIVVMNWSSAEFPTEADFDRHFHRFGVTFIAASGDRPGVVGYPAASPFVVSVGGTSLNLRPDGTIRSEVPWLGAGWGTSAYEAAPPYQRGDTCAFDAFHRIVPDVSYSADPWFGYAVYSSDSGRGGWFGLGGTSAGAPQWAALLALARQAAAGSGANGLDLISRLYRVARNDVARVGFRDPISTANTACATGKATWYSPIIGLGSPVVDRLVPLLGQGS